MTLQVAIITIVLSGLPMTQQGRSARLSLCHYDEEAMAYKLLTIGEKAVEAHLRNHELDGIPGAADLDDQCEPVSAVVFARAYINRDGIPGYDPSADVEVARLEDSNGSGVFDADDTLITSVFPLDFDGSAFTPALATHHVVSAVYWVHDSVLWFGEGSSSFFFYDGDENPSDRYIELHRDGDIYLVDNHRLGNDQIFLQAGAPSQPALPWLIGKPGIADDPWLDVEVDLAGGL